MGGSAREAEGGHRYEENATARRRTTHEGSKLRSAQRRSVERGRSLLRCDGPNHDGRQGPSGHLIAVWCARIHATARAGSEGAARGSEAWSYSRKSLPWLPARARRSALGPLALSRKHKYWRCSTSLRHVALPRAACGRVGAALGALVERSDASTAMASRDGARRLRSPPPPHANPRESGACHVCARTSQQPHDDGVPGTRGDASRGLDGTCTAHAARLPSTERTRLASRPMVPRCAAARDVRAVRRGRAGGG